MVYQARTGSASGLVGTIDAIDSDHLDLQLVDLDGTWENEILTIAVDQVISLLWGDDYLDALSDLLADHPAPTGPGISKQPDEGFTEVP